MATKKNTSTTTKTTETTPTVQTAETNVTTKVQAKVTIPNDELVEVTNVTQSRLVLVDSDGFKNVLENFEDTIEMEFGELVKLKKRYIKVFTENWIELNPVVLKALGVDKYYKDFINVDEFESLFALSESELRDKVSKLSKSMKQSVGMKALNLIEEGKLDSIKKIKVLEEVLGYSLIES
jgi:hypothetical protein